jgi:hypothetical protein
MHSGASAMDEIVTPVAVSLETLAQGEYPSSDGGSRAKPETTFQAEARYSLFLSEKPPFRD